MPFWTDTFWPQRSASAVTSGPPSAFVKNDVPAEKYVTKSTTFSRSFVSVSEDMPRSYLPPARAGMMLSNDALTTFARRPITAASAVARSASVPSTVLPSEPMNSFGA